ncbi:putative pentatricopeptide repeat-containing protein [Hibiscus syriacus]|uniref:Pentatricopeptide repeat-containing protein n=1 Tax=Hibiscus syriacus TaxID=106335 RepID=A0A6A2XA85_HIBSY|nr:putative pentatricopeptide repeat-containing protein [Hibiscus syriacus]
METGSLRLGLMALQFLGSIIFIANEIHKRLLFDFLKKTEFELAGNGKCQVKKRVRFADDVLKTTLPCSIFPKKLNIGNNKGSGDQKICLNMKYLVRFHHFHSQSGVLLHFSRHKPLALHFSSISKSSKQTKKAQQAEACRIPSLFQEITDILGSVNVTPDETESGFSITPRNTASELEFIEQSLSRRPGVCQNAQQRSELVEKERNEITEIFGAVKVTSGEIPSGFSVTPRTNARESGFIKQSSSGRPDVYQNAQEKSELVGTEENVTALDDNRMGNSVEFDVSPVVHEITKIVRAENALISMEEQLDKSGFSFEPEIVEKVLKRCFKVPHLAFRFFNWVKVREGFSYTTEVFNTMLYVSGEAKGFGLVEKILEEMEAKSCKKDIKTWTIIISQYGKSKMIGKALEVFENMKRCGFEPDTTTYTTMVRALCNAEKGELALEFYKEMVEKEMSLDSNSYKMLLNCVAKSGDTDSVHLVADNMMRVSEIPEQEVYGYVLKSFCISGRIKEALEFIRDLRKKDLSLDPLYFEILIKGLCRADRIADAMEIVDIMKRRQLITEKVYEIIINGYLRRNDFSKAFDLFQSMKESGFLPAASTYTDLMQCLFRSKEYKKGCDLYNEMLEKGVEPDTVAIMAMVVGHVGQNRISEAWKVFNSMEDRGIRPTWKAYSVFIKELGKGAKTDEIFRVLCKMQEEKVVIRDDDIFRWIISNMERNRETDIVEKLKQMQRISKIHAQADEVSNNGFKGQDILLDLGDKCLEPNRIDCNQVQSLSKAFNEQDLEEVYRILSSSKDWFNVEEGLERCNIKFTPELEVEILRKSSLHGKNAFNFFSWAGKQAGYQHTSETYNRTIKISGCGKDFKNMRKLFYEMKRRGCLVSDAWAIMIMQYGRTGLTEIALRTFTEMKSDGFNPTASTYKYLMISLCGRKGRKVDEAVQILQEMIRSGFNPDKELLETYLGCLCEVDKLTEARSCVESLSKIGFSAPLSYSLYIRALCRAGLEETLEILDNARIEQSPLDQYVYGSLVHAMLRKGRFEQALVKVNSLKQANIHPTVHVYTSLIVYYFKEKQIGSALAILAKMEKEGCLPTIVTYSAMIRSYMDTGRLPMLGTSSIILKMNGLKPGFKTYSVRTSYCWWKLLKFVVVEGLLSYLKRGGAVGICCGGGAAAGMEQRHKAPFLA